MAEAEQVKKADSGSKLFAVVRQRIDDLVSHGIWPPIRSINQGDWDKFEVKDRKVQEKQTI